MRFLTNLLSAIAGVFRRSPEPDPQPSSSATMELSEEDIELLYER